MGFTYAPAHLALAQESWTGVARRLDLTPKRFTCAPAHLAFPRSWTAVPRRLDFAPMGFTYAPTHLANRSWTGIPRRLAFTSRRFTCAPAHLALPHRSQTCVPRSLAFTPMCFTFAPAHLAFPRSWTGVPRSLDFALRFHLCPCAGACCSCAFVVRPQRFGVLSRLDFSHMGFTYAPTRLA